MTAQSTASSLRVSVSEHQSVRSRHWHADASRGGQQSLFLFLTLAKVSLAGTALPQLARGLGARKHRGHAPGAGGARPAGSLDGV